MANYQAQLGLMDAHQRGVSLDTWRDARVAEARKMGMTHFRVSNLSELFVVEGWREQPESEGPVQAYYQAGQ